MYKPVSACCRRTPAGTHFSPPLVSGRRSRGSNSSLHTIDLNSFSTAHAAETSAPKTVGAAFAELSRRWAEVRKVFVSRVVAIHPGGGGPHRVSFVRGPGGQSS